MVAPFVVSSVPSRCAPKEAAHCKGSLCAGEESKPRPQSFMQRVLRLVFLCVCVLAPLLGHSWLWKFLHKFWAYCQALAKALRSQFENSDF